MAIDFPANPSLNDTYASGGRTWRWNGTGWAVQPVTLTAGAIIAGLGYQPVSPLGNVATASTWQTARTLTVGSTGKAVDGSAAVSWSLAEIGAPSTTGTGASGSWGIDITGNASTASTWQTGRTIALTGDVTGTSGTFNGSANLSFAATLANSGVAAGTYNDSATQVRPFTVDAKGRVTGVGTAVTVTPAFSSITSKPTTLAGYGISDALPAAGGTLTGNLSNTSTGFLQASVGTTAQRPASPAQGMVRFNTSRGCFEGYTGSAWVNMSPLTVDDVGGTA